MKRYTIAFMVGTLLGAAATNSWLVGVVVGSAAVPALVVLNVINVVLERRHENDRNKTDS